MAIGNGSILPPDTSSSRAIAGRGMRQHQKRHQRKSNAEKDRNGGVTHHHFHESLGTKHHVGIEIDSDFFPQLILVRRQQIGKLASRDGRNCRLGRGWKHRIATGIQDFRQAGNRCIRVQPETAP